MPSKPGNRVLWVVAGLVVLGLGFWTHHRLTPYGEQPGRAVAPVASKQDRTQAPTRPPIGATKQNRRTPIAKPLPADILAREPPAVSVHLQESANRVGELYANFNEQTYRELFAKGPPPEVLQELFDWYGGVLGRCQPPQPFLVRDQQRARFLFPCEHGHLEAELRLDDEGNIVRMLQGARGVDPGTAVLEAAERVMQLLDTWDEQVFLATFGDGFAADEMRPFLAEFQAEWGPCELDDIDLANARGALIDLACAQGPRMMKIDLQHDDDRIRVFRLAAPRPVAWK